MPNYYTYDSSNLRERNKYTSTVDTKYYGVKRYFSSIDTAVYFGADAVEEIVAIDFTIQEPKLPIYGFNSFFPNRLITGRRTITGTFAINFTKTDYLANILKNIDDSVLASDYDVIIQRCYGNEPHIIFDKEFDITIGYGYSKIDSPSYGASMQSLLGVRIVEYRQALDTEGNPILDMYSFIAKDLEIGIKEVNQLSIDTAAYSIRPANAGEEEDDTVDNKEVDYILANYYIEEERTKLSSQCMNNTDLWGIEFTPTLYQEGSMYYAKLDVIHTNKQSGSKLSSVKVVLIDQDKGINLALNMTIGKQFTFSNSSREQIKKFFNDSEANSIKATIEFSIILDGKTIDIPYDTLFFKNKK